MLPLFVDSCVGEHCRVEELPACPNEHAAIWRGVSAKNCGETVYVKIYWQLKITNDMPLLS